MVEFRRRSGTSSCGLHAREERVDVGGDDEALVDLSEDAEPLVLLV